MLYNNETFNKYCEDNEITLLENYEQIKLNRDYKIKGRCITCDCNNEFDKSFRQLIKTGAYCYNCCVNALNFYKKLGSSCLKTMKL